uniref:RING-type domain-containing protein n=1 Tax=Moniliophthora roreri TaxID=221103 RepID=A0A0W0F0M2_MONRR
MSDHHQRNTSAGGFFSNIFRSLVSRRSDADNSEQVVTNDVEMSSNDHSNNVDAHNTTTRIPAVTVDDDYDREIPPLQDVSDSEDEGEDDMYLNVGASMPPSSEVSNAPSPMTQSSSNAPSPLPAPHRSSQRRARVEDDDDQERDRRHPSERVNDSLNPSISSNDNDNNTLPRRHPAISVSIDLGPGPSGPIPIPIGRGQGQHFRVRHHHHNHNQDENSTNGPSRLLPGVSLMEFTNQQLQQPQQPSNSNPMPAQSRQQPHRHTHPPFPGPGIVVPLPVVALPGLFRALSASLRPPNSDEPPPGPDIFTLFGGLGGPPEEKEDTVKGKQVVAGLEVVPTGLVHRLARANRELGEGEDGMDGAGCAICWEKLIPDETGDVTEAVAKSEVGSSSSAYASSVAPAEEKTSGSLTSASEATSDESETKIVSLPCAHIFHAACLVPWFSRPRQTTCPVCRFDLDPEGLIWGMSRSRRGMGGGLGGGFFGMNDFMRMFGGPAPASNQNGEAERREGEANGAQHEGAGQGQGAPRVEGENEGTGQAGQVLRDLFELGRALGVGRDGPIQAVGGTQPVSAGSDAAPGTAQAPTAQDTAERAGDNTMQPPLNNSRPTSAASNEQPQSVTAATGEQTDAGNGDQRQVPGDEQLREMVHRFVSGLFGGAIGGPNQPNVRVLNTGRMGGPIQVVIDMPPRRQASDDAAQPPGTGGAPVTSAPPASENITNPTPAQSPHNPPTNNQNHSGDAQLPPQNDDRNSPPLADLFDIFLGTGPPPPPTGGGGDRIPRELFDFLRRPQPGNADHLPDAPPPGVGGLDLDGDVIMDFLDTDEEEFEASMARFEHRHRRTQSDSSTFPPHPQDRNGASASSSQQTHYEPSQPQQSGSPSSTQSASPPQQQPSRPHVHRHSIPGGYVSMVTGTADSMDDAMRQIMGAISTPHPSAQRRARAPPSPSSHGSRETEQRTWQDESERVRVGSPPLRFTSAPGGQFPPSMRVPGRPAPHLPPHILTPAGGEMQPLSPFSASQRAAQGRGRQASAQMPNISAPVDGELPPLPPFTAGQRETQERGRAQTSQVPNVFAPWMNMGTTSSRRTPLRSSSMAEQRSSRTRPAQASSSTSFSDPPRPQSQPQSRPQPPSPVQTPASPVFDEETPMTFSQFLRTTAGLPRAPPPGRRGRPPKKWSAPLPPGLTLRERIEKKEREAGLRCADPSCGVGPNDDEPFVEGQKKQVRIRAKKSVKGKEKEEANGEEVHVCDHSFHPSCLVSAHRVAMSMYARDEEEVGEEVEVECSFCRSGGVYLIARFVYLIIHVISVGRAILITSHHSYLYYLYRTL